MLQEPEQYKRLRASIDPYMAKVTGNIMEDMTMEGVEEMDYIKLAYMETMRRDAPFSISTTSCMSRDIKIGGVTMYAEEAFWVGIQALQKDAEQWRDPEAFVPDRFDPNNTEWFHKPNGGGKRSHFAYVPFLGGTRVCLGKTFAEVTLRFTIPLWFHFFDFDFTLEEQRRKRPIVVLGCVKAIEIPLKLKTRNKVSDLPNFTVRAH